jgi:predicted ATP-dependent protease
VAIAFPDLKLDAKDCRWICDSTRLGFETTVELHAEHRILGQPDAVEALRFGLDSRVHGNNVFVRGLSGFGRIELIHEMIEETARGAIKVLDHCYVHNFEQPDQPKLLNLPTGMGRPFKDTMDEFATFVEVELPAYLNSELVKSKQKHLVSITQEEIQRIGSPFDKELHESGLAMVPMTVGQNMLPVILPVIDKKPVPYDELEQMRRDGRLTDAEIHALSKKVAEFELKFAELGQSIGEVQLRHQQALENLIIEEARQFFGARVAAITRTFNIAGVLEFLDQIVTDLVAHRLKEPSEDAGFSRLYRVNLVTAHAPDAKFPVISLTNPTLTNLVGKIDREVSANTLMMRSDHLMIKPGALLEADGGYLIIEAQEILAEPGAWATLLRTLKTGLLEVYNPDPFGLWGVPQLRPQAIEIDVKVVLVGDPALYSLLDEYEPRFSQLFKVLADFSDTLNRDEAGYAAYANVIARLVDNDRLLNFTAAAVAGLIEQGARICAQQGRLSSRFGRIADIAREASFIARREGDLLVDARHVKLSVKQGRRRAEIPARRFKRLLAEGGLRIEVAGRVVGQMNGLAVTMAGPLIYGFPTRITASIGPGSAGAVNIERESELSGAVHTKGFLILSGLLRFLLRLQHPMAFSASIAFEQTYGGIDGDSASGAEICCLISALTDLPIRQDLAMTGAVDQKGNILPIGAVSEKIEGFFEACQTVGFSDTQGVVIPAANARELMLRDDVLEAVAAGKFSIYAVSDIYQALGLVLDRAPGEALDDEYTEGTVLAIAQTRAHDYWKIAKSHSKSD